MSLFGALSSGVSGLTAQSSAMGAISDNITNVSTIGYKNARVNFQTLVTKQTSSTFYSAGGVQSKPRQDTGIQGLLQASTSQTDISLSGKGFFVVNEANVPGNDDQFLYSRAGSFFQDNEGFLRNTSGFFLQAWPVNADGDVIPANKSLTIANQNIVSTDYLATVNLNRVGGTAAATTNISIGANLPSNDTAGATHKTDVQFFDTLGNANTMSVVYSRSIRENEWSARIDPPAATSVITIEDSSVTATAKVYQSIGQLEFNIPTATGDTTRRPADGSTVVIDSVTYEFRTAATTTATPAAAVTFTHNTGAADTIVGTAGQLSSFVAGDRITISGTTNNNKTYTVGTAAGAGTTITLVASDEVTTEALAGGATTLSSVGAEVWVNTLSNTTLANDVADLVTTVKAYDIDYTDFGDGPTSNGRISLSAGSSTTVLFKDDGTGAITVDPTGLLDTSGVAVSTQTQSFTVKKPDLDYTDTTQLKFSSGNLPANADTIVVNGITYTFSTAETGGALNDGDKTVFTSVTATGDNLATLLIDLEDAIEANDPSFASGGSRVQARSTGTGLTLVDTLVLTSLATGSYDVVTSGVTSAARPAEVDGTSFSSTTITVNTKAGIKFNSDGLPNEFNIAELEILDFSDGAANMDDDPANSPQITVDFGTIGEANGMTQFGASYTPVFITQNGSRFGTFAGVSLNTSGLMTALFDNGETRPIFQLPVATFTNVNGLEGRTGNVWNATEASGDFTLRTPDNGPAGQTIQSALEASTVDIGEEFTNMIVVQRAYSAAAKIISTADQMLEELMRTKR
ncbi:MAG: flagellar hook-basal body complex protein [Rhodospirillales bacterium]|jgi:flagellar hook protein FlgE|nr:flagellar hook-basal body complex protein [Rhodospirillales bacterium]